MNEPNQGAELTPLKRAYLAIEELQRRLDAATQPRPEPIAIVGAGCRLPGNVDNLDALWALLRDGVDAITETPRDRWEIDAWYDPDVSAPGKMSTRHGGFVPNVDQFDPQFFNIAPREAAAMDPQQRLLLEVTWEALENAAIAPAQLTGTRTGVYVAVTTNDYAQVHRTERGLEGLDAYYASGIAHSIASGRLSYVLGLEGPSLSVDTACSSSLVAIHLAVQSLRTGECRTALAGGVNLLLSPELSITLSKYQMMAPDGRCKFGDARADGFVRAEGCAVVVLKRLRDAVAEGDPILAVIRGTAANQDGASSGLTAPNGPSQEAVVRAALADAGVSPADIGYVEAHGTGTALGDPIELQALGAVFGPGRPADAPLAVGSIKSNIGHNEAAAGISGLLKLALVLQRGEIPPSLHFATPNPLIDWDDLPVSIPTVRTPWPAGARPRLGGVSSFGFSGTNVHIVLEEPPAQAAALASPPAGAAAIAADTPTQLLPLSARSATALRALADRYVHALTDEAAPALADVAFTAGSGRNHFAHRLVVNAADNSDAAAQLAAFAAGQHPPGVYTHHVRQVDPPAIAFLFTGQGAQYAGMGRTLYAAQPAFRAMLDRCASILAEHMDRPLLALILAEPESADARLLDQTTYTQPALVAFEIALAALWQSWGVSPTTVLGHSVGEFAAAWMAGVLSLEDTLALVAARGHLMGALPEGGAMAAIFTAAEDVEAMLVNVSQGRDQVVIAAINGPAHTVISGPTDGVQAMVDRCTNAGTRAQRLAVSHAFHSPLMEPMLDDLTAAAAAVTHNAPRLRLISNLTGEPVGRDMAQPDYWRRHARRPVRFAQSLETLARTENLICIEIGPHAVLTGMALAALPEDASSAQDGILWLPSLRKGRDAWAQLAESVATLYTHGGALDWAAFNNGQPRRKVHLPTYPFARERCWVMPLPGMHSTPGAPQSAGNMHPLLGRRLRSALKQAQFEAQISQTQIAYLRDHQVMGRAILPATAFIEIALAAAKAAGQSHALLQELSIHAPLAVADDTIATLQTILIPPTDAQQLTRVEILSQPADEAVWTLHVSGEIGAASDQTAPAPAQVSLEAIRARCPEKMSAGDHYAQMAARGLDFGPSLRGVQQLWLGEGEVLGLVELPAAQAADADDYQIHPALLDACIQCLSGLMLDVDATFLPMHIAQVALWRPAPPRAWAHATLQAPGAASSANETRLGDVTLYDDNGKPLVGLTGLLLKRVTGNTFGAHTQPAEWLYEVAWRTQSLPATATMLADPQIAADAASAALPALQEMVDLPRYYPQMNDLDALATAYAVTALHALGWEPAPGQRVKEEALAAQLAIAPAQRSLFARWLQHLAADGLLRATDGGWHVVASLPSSPPSATRVAEMAARYPEAAADIELTRRCGEGLAAVLRGEADPLHLLFPDGSLEETERLYRTSPWSRVYTHGVAEAIAALAERGLDRPLCVLEIGGGTGGTTSAVLPRLAGHEVEYQFTDISPFFLARAQERFSAYPFVSYKPLDIERSPLEQGFVPHSVDCVIAANVIHATADLRATLANVRTLLAPGGVLILQEMTQPLRWIDLTFGMTEGWWRFTDRALRPGYALLNRAEWLELLADAGFEAAVGVPQVDAGRAPEDLPYQSVLVAQMPAAQARGPLCIFADDGGLGEELRALALAEGRTVVLVRPGSSYLADGDEYQVNPLSMEEHERLLHETGAGQAANGDIVYLWALDEAARLPSDSVKLMQIEERLLGGALNLTRALARSGASARLWIVTRGAQAVGGSVPSPLQATLWGFGKSVAREHDELQCTLIDLDVLPGPVADPVQRAEAVHLQHEFDASTCAQQIALRAGERMEARLAPLQGTAQASSTDTPVELVISARGSLDNLRLQPAARRTPDAQEVEIRVEAAALNFKDVLNTLGMYPGDPGQPGSECAGEVVAVGSTVTGLQPGDKVVALAPGCMRSYVTVHTNKVALRPPHLTAQEAITLPIAYITAAFALEQVGQMQRGERVLIHAAAGGVGMAAVRLALQGGLTVFATAGSPAKQDFVRALGVEQVFDSRTLDFADGVLAATNGQGVDLVLNSLAGDFATASLRTLAAGGRFLELGKRDLLTDTEVAALERPIDYHVIDWGETAQAEPELIHRMLVDVMDGVGAGRVTPLPLRTFPLAAAVDAFRTMAQARHIGKIVLTVQPPDIPREQVRSNATYLITGGLGGLGLVAAKWLVAQGARSITLMGRHAPGADAQAVIEALAAEGAQITVVQGDVASADDVRRALHAGDQTAYPLRGVIHAAGVLDDGALTQQSWARFAPVLAPKVQGAWNLHQQTADLPLDFFVFYSSIASLLGSPGQSNHAAANSFMSALAHVRRAAGQPGLSIDWGAWSAVGAAVSRGVDARVGDAGMGTIAPDEGMELLRLLLQMDVAEAAVLPMEWGRYLRNWAGDKIPPFFAEVASLAAQSVAQSATAGARLHAPAADTSVDESAAPSAPPDIVQQLASASPQRRKALLLDMVRTTAGRVLALPTTRIDDDAPLSALGLDSLMAVELRNLLGSELVLARRLPATLAFDYPSVAAIAGYLATELGDTASPAGAQPNEPASPAPVGDGSAARSMLDSLDSLEELSDAEVERLLAERMTGA